MDVKQGIQGSREVMKCRHLDALLTFRQYPDLSVRKMMAQVFANDEEMDAVKENNITLGYFAGP